MNKKVLFVIGSFEVGGSRTSLLNLFNNLKNERIFCLPLSDFGELRSTVPPTVEILQASFWQKTFFRPTNLFAKALWLLLKAFSRFFSNKAVHKFIYKNIAKAVRKKYGEFDVAFGYQEGVSNDAAGFIFARTHYSWIHSNLGVWFDKRSFIKETYDNSEKIIFVSQKTMNGFLEMFDAYMGKTIVIQNTICADTIRLLSQEMDVFNGEGCLRLVSVGRLNKEKRFDRVIYAAKELKKLVPFVWTIVGDGPLFKELRALIIKEGLEEDVIMVGQKINPYVYIGQSDLLVVSSSTESQPMVIIESLILGTPVLSTNFPSAVEMLGDNAYSAICENSTDALTKTLIRLVGDGSIELMKKEAKAYHYSNDLVLGKIYALINCHGKQD